MVEWQEAPRSVIDIAQRIIKAHHPHLLEVDVAFIMRSEAPVTNGVTTLVKAEKRKAAQRSQWWERSEMRQGALELDD